MKFDPKICGLIWVTGFSGAGKTTFATELQEYLRVEYDVNPILLDGDAIREVLKQENAHTPQDRLLLANKYSVLSSRLVEQGHCVICSTISMFQTVRDFNRSQNDNYCEVFIDVDDDIRIKRRDIGSLTKAEASNEASIFQLPSNSDIVIHNPTIEELKLSCTKIKGFIENGWKNP